jgi:hypothetical protein
LSSEDGGAAARRPRTVRVLAFAGACLLVDLPVAFDFSRTTAKLAAGTIGAAIGAGAFVGETGLARNDFDGDGGGRKGDCGSVLELCDFGDRTEDGFIRREAARPTRFVVVCGFAILLRFLGFSKSARMFSLSDVPRNSVLVRLIPLEGEEEVAVLGREFELASFSGASGSGFESTGG